MCKICFDENMYVLFFSLNSSGSFHDSGLIFPKQCFFFAAKVPPHVLRRPFVSHKRKGKKKLFLIPQAEIMYGRE